MNINSTRLRQLAKRYAQAGRLAIHSLRDNVRFWRHSALSTFDSSFEQLNARIMYNVHALEKGLAQEADWRPGRGRKALANLNDALVMFVNQGYDRSTFSYQQGIAILRRYMGRHKGHEDALSFLPSIVSREFLATADTAGPDLTGVKVVRRQDKVDNHRKSFYEISQARSSVRSFSGHPIDGEKVRAAIRNAEKTPSVCNRQGWRVYWTENKALMREVLTHQRGFSYPQMPEVLLAVTVSNSTFISPVERNQGFIDGGLYSMSVLYGLEAEGLAAVPLNACLYASARSAVSELLEIDASEEIIMFIAIGDHPDVSVVPVSDRRPADSFIRRR